MEKNAARQEDSEIKRVSDLAILFRFTDALYRADSLADIYDATFEAIFSALKCRRASILRFDNAGVMRFVAWRGLSQAYRDAVDGHSPWKSGDTDAAPIFVNDIDSSGEDAGLIATIKAEDIRALAFIPLMSNNAVIGKFMTYDEAPHVFTQDEADLAVAISRQLGFAIDRHRAEEARRLAEAGLHRNEERLRQILDSAKEYAIITLDDVGRIASWNSGAERLLGYTKAEALGRSGDIFFTPEDRAAEAPEQEMRMAREEGRATNERWHMRKDGSRFWGSGVMLPVVDGGQDAYLKIFRNRTEEREADQRQKLLIGELNHRVKNTLATVQSIAGQTLKTAETPKAFATAFNNRILALASAHDLLTREVWEGAYIKDIATAVLRSWMEEGRVSISGPDARVTPKQALALSMAVNELMTNAIKHGALSVPDGRVTLTWACDKRCEVQWVESGGPPVSPPQREGFGLRVLNRALAAELGKPVKLEFERSGLRCSILLKMNADIQQGAEPVLEDRTCG
jgi:PAS domain S-box-containing protein